MPEEYEQQQETPPAQRQTQPGVESRMDPEPVVVPPHYRGSGKLDGKVALVTGGDSGIGRSVAALFAIEGADVSIAYLEEHGDAEETKHMVEAERRRCTLIPGDLRDPSHCTHVVERTVEVFGKLDVLVNHAGEQHMQERFEDITTEQLVRSFETNVFSMFHLTKAALGQMSDAVWTPLIPATFPDEKVESFGEQTPMDRVGQPSELSPAYVYLASDNSSFVTGQVIHVNGGSWVGS